MCGKRSNDTMAKQIGYITIIDENRVNLIVQLNKKISEKCC